MERDCESELSKLNIEQNACIYHFGASVIHGQRSNILRLHSKEQYSYGIYNFSITRYGIFCTSYIIQKLVHRHLQNSNFPVLQTGIFVFTIVSYLKSYHLLPEQLELFQNQQHHLLK